MDEASLLALLSPVERLALAYAPRDARGPNLALFALDSRLSGIVRAAREPALAQIRLAWWRDRLRARPEDWPRGEPVLAALTGWSDHARGLEALVDGWEELLGEPTAEGFERFAGGRAASWRALASMLGADAEDSAIDRAGQGWALADLAAHLSHSSECELAANLLAAQEAGAVRLPRALRPLAVLYALARRSKGRHPLLSGPGALLTALRVGITGG